MNNNNNLTSVVMDLENLQINYSNLLIKYQKAISDYINFLNFDSNNKLLIEIAGSVFLGSKDLSQNNSPTLKDCEVSCLNTTGCTGATFNSTAYEQPMCLLKSGDGPLIKGLATDYAIIPKGKQLIMNIDNLNRQLISINKKITDKIKSDEPIYNKNNLDVLNQSQKLQSNYKELLEERNNINSLLNEYKTLDEINEDNQIKINQNYYYYIILFIVVIIVVFLLIKLTTLSNSQVQYGGKLDKNAYYILFIIVIITIAINYGVKYLSFLSFL